MLWSFNVRLGTRMGFQGHHLTTTMPGCVYSKVLQSDAEERGARPSEECDEARGLHMHCFEPFWRMGAQVML